MLKSLERRRILQESEEAQEIEKALCAADPHYFLFNDQKYVRTFDSYDQSGANKVKPFPEKAYMPYVLSVIHGSSEPVFLPKSRQIMMTWLVCAYLWWDARFHPYELNFVQSKKEEDAANLVFNKSWTTARISFMEYNLPDWMKDPKVAVSYGIISYSNGSKIWGIPQGDDIIRSYTPSIVFGDEAAFQQQAEGAYKAAKAAARKIIMVSSAEPSWFGKTCGLQQY